MAIDLLRSFMQKGQNITQNQKTENTQSTQTPQNLQVLRAVHALKAGQTLQGEIISVKGENVQLAVMKDVILEAKLAQSMNLTPGTTMMFQIKSNSGNSMSLLPLFTNTAADPNALKALDMAGIPVTDRALEMVKALMQRGLPIDKQSLQEVYREVAAFKDADVGSIISLRQMNMPVTAENLQQLSLYENNQHFLADTFTDIGKAIGQQLGSWMAEGNVEAAKEFVNALKQMFVGEAAVQSGEPQAGQQIAGEGGPAGNLPLDEALNNSGKTVISEEMLANNAEKAMQQGKEAALMEDVGKQAAKNQETKANQTENMLQWDKLLEMVSKEKNPGKAVSFFEKLWEQNMKEQWMLEPETVMNKGKVQDFYEKLTHQVKQLETLLDNHGENNTPAAKAVHNTASNLEFMNQLNQTYAYMQLPLKLKNQQANSELYVYTNKKSLAKQDGKVTALLHLDMQNLGSMDIYVAMENQKVSTQFYLEKEEYLDFLENHMDLLTARLNKRGYDCSIKTSLKAEAQEESIMKQIENSQNSPMLLSMQAFDMRA